MQIDGRNFLVPVDVEIQAAAAYGCDGRHRYDLAGLDDQVRTNILILDACRNNPMAARRSGSADPSRAVEAGSGLAAPASLGAGSTLGAGTLIAFATAPGQVALDGEGANSPFSSALLRHVGTPGLEVQQMLTRVRAEVVAATKNQAGAMVELVAIGRGLSGGRSEVSSVREEPCASARPDTSERSADDRFGATFALSPDIACGPQSAADDRRPENGFNCLVSTREQRRQLCLRRRSSRLEPMCWHPRIRRCPTRELHGLMGGV